MPEGSGHTIAPGLASAPRAEAVATVTGGADVGATWRAAGFTFALAFVALLGIYHETVLDLIDGWSRTGTFAHGYIIFPVSAWLIWRIRDHLAPLVPRAQPLALVPLVAAGALWLVGRSAEVHAPEQYAFVAMVPCLVWGVFGNAVTKRILFPLAFLFFAVPAGDFLMPTLMDHTADFTVTALRLSGVPVFREGNYFSIPSGNWSVVEACSGLRYLIASVTLGCLFAYLNYQRPARRAAFIVASFLVPILANWLRAYMIVMLAHLSSNALATGVDHLIYGWLFFGVVMLVLFWVGSFWREDEPPVATAADIRQAREAAPVTASSRPRVFVAAMVAMLAVALPWPAVAAWLGRLADAPHPGVVAVGDVSGWTAGQERVSSFVPHYIRARSTFDETFANGDRKVNLFVAYYSGQSTNGSLVTFDNDVVIVADKVWGAVARRGVTADVAGQPLGVVETVVKGDAGHGDERLLTWRWYWINGRLTTSNYFAKAYTALDKITGQGDDSAVIVVTTPIPHDGDRQAQQAIADFVAVAEPKIVAALTAQRAEARR